MKKPEQPDSAGLFGAILQREFAGVPMAETASTAGDVDATLNAHLDRIAAAIAEIAKTSEPMVQLSLPLGNYRIDGAILGRDAVGNVTILLIAGSAVPPTVAAQWSEQLNERLLRRDVRVGKINVQAMEKRVTPA